MQSLLTLIAACGAPPPTEPPGTTAHHGQAPPELPTKGDWCDAPMTTPPPASAHWVAAGTLPAGDIVQLREGGGQLWAGSWLSGIWTTSDRGVSWSGLGAQISHVYGQLAVHDTDPRYAAYPASNVWATVDGGVTWAEASVLGAGARFEALEYIDDTLVAMDDAGGVWNRPAAGGELVAVGTMPGVSPPHTLNWDRRSYWFAEDQGALFAWQSDFELWRSDDVGVTWRRVLAERIHPNSVVARGGEVWAAARRDTGTAVLHSADGGSTWQELVVVQAALDVHGLAVGPGGEVFLIDDFFVYVVDGAGVELVLPEGALNLMSIYADDGGRVYLGNTLGVAQSDDGGLTWRSGEGALVDPDAAALYAVPGCPGHLFAGTRCRSGLFRSTDWGQTFTRVNAYFHYVMVIRSAPQNMGQLWVTSDDAILYSSDFGETWFTGRVRVDEGGNGLHVHGLAVDPEAACGALVGSVGSGTWEDERPTVYRTDDCGWSWTDSGTGLPDGEHSVHALEFLPEDPAVVLLGTFRGGDIAHDGEPGVGMFRSTDGGASWSPVDAAGARDVAMFALCDGLAWAATDAGMLQSVDQGASWTVSLEAPPDREFVAAACAGAEVVALDDGSGVWRLDEGGAWYADQDGLGPPNGTQYTHGVELDPDARRAWVTAGQGGVFVKSVED